MGRSYCRRIAFTPVVPASERAAVLAFIDSTKRNIVE